MSNVPLDLQALRELGRLHVVWNDGETDFPFVFLRRQCQCAQCVNEWTGEQILDPASVSDDISVESMDLVGSYAVRIHWSDGHNSGLFTWDRLRELSRLLES
ncbi:DUF971 domain-containing protein [Bythopirellula polymerisocia]|uniref:Gamma-butyrobetaine dioxygenase n=1 Tax=Bythopirellula polymerisocia TaxID=2528003 RepID=A0A5C6C8G8_9BACT|nr:DUF971 domain-containing protein [Bythopirellula polymerisocia]TWU20840.1 Gamma-butyrobetaine dioxygenase [Bythopirellula polymerisocia]